MQKRYYFIYFCLVLLAFAGPGLLEGYWLRVFTSMFMYATLALAINIISGFTGYIALGNVVFFGLGAIASGIVITQGGVNQWIAIPIAGMVGGIYALVFGCPILRLKGAYFVMGTIGLNEATRQFILNLKITGGAKGIIMPVVTEYNPHTVFSTYYYAMLFLLLLSVAISVYISHSKWGYAFKAIKANERVARSIGINATFYKVVAWTFSGILTAMAGSIYASWVAYIDPWDVFNLTVSVKSYIMMLLGGAGTVFGPLIGATFLEILGEYVWVRATEFHLGTMGILMMLVILLIPNGILGVLHSLKDNLAEGASGVSGIFGCNLMKKKVGG